jgi:diguanylate cyclase (GGDEF)-like protein
MPRSFGGRPPLNFASDGLELITRDAAQATKALTGLLVRATAEDTLDVICGWGTSPSEERLSLPAGRSGFVGRVLESGCAAGEPIVAGNGAPLATTAPNAQVRYAVGAPVRPPGGFRGALCVGLADAPGDLAGTIWLVESYARAAALLLHDGRGLGSILASSRHDALTGCLNYAAIHSEVEREIARSARYGDPLSCCFVDLDRFKEVNEQSGHLRGSRVLAEVAAVLREGVRVHDSVGRYGGDEFIVLLPNTELGAAHALAARLRESITSATTARGDERLDASIGVAQWRPGTTADELLAAADAVLRCAKRDGGGQVVSASDAAAGAERSAMGAGDAAARGLAAASRGPAGNRSRGLTARDELQRVGSS